MTISTQYPAIRPSLLLDFVNARRLDPRITFARASAARYYDASTVAKAEENLLTQSQNFGNAAWTKLAGAITTDTSAAPDGTTTADTFTENSATSQHGVNFVLASVSGVTYTGSVFVKAGTRTWAYLAFANLANGAVWINLSTGALGTQQAAVSAATVTSVGNGWYRVTATWTANGATNYMTVGAATGDTVASYAGDGTSTILLWCAQLEQRSGATAYTVTTTAPVTNYVPQLMTAASGQPRIDFDPLTRVCRGLLIEESRQNLLTQSEAFENAAWTKDANRGTFVADVVSPDGTISGRTLTAGSGNFGYAYRSVSVTAGVAYTLSIYAKPGSVAVAWFDLCGAPLSYVNLSTLVTTPGAGVTMTATAVGNGWVRITATATATAASHVFGFGAANAVGSQTMTSGATAVFYGAQVEAGAFATSYVSTTTTALTRQADVASMTGANFSAWFNQSEGTLFGDGSIFSLAPSFPLLAGLTNGSNSYVSLGKADAASATASALVVSSGASQANMTFLSAISVSTPFKMAVGYRVNDFASSANAATAVTDTSGVVPVLNQLQIGSNSSFSSWNGHIRKIAYWPRRLLNSELVALTR